ncbi:MAG TPA: extracellular matrix/biofilm biosynthesis regulator RemA family protein [Halanaerobiales bacterium]|nr:extracellular matrix/biofilm biosynthesis regulator RemA family protein [Halanaerobiales bacterium]
MFLHLGGNQMIPVKDIVMIGDFNNDSESKITAEFFEMAREEGFIIDYSSGNPQSFILTDETIYLSMISSDTLKKRIYKLPGSNIEKIDIKSNIKSGCVKW